jgi:hypothetical protein
MVGSKVAVKVTTRLIKVSLGTPLCKGINMTPQYQFDASGA